MDANASASDGAWGYSYDAMGNRKQASASSGSGTPDVTTYAANSLNQYSAVTNSAFSASPREIRPAYDLNGNMTWDGTNAYFWDLQIKRAQSPRQGRRATAILRPSRSDGARSGNPRRSGNCYQLVLVSNAEVQVASAYDAMGRRVRKVVSRRDAETQSWGVEKTCHFFYDGWNLVMETVGSGSMQSAVTNRYTWGNDLSGSLQGDLLRRGYGGQAGGVGGLLAVSCVSSNTSYLSPLTYYPLYDHNGNVERYVSRSGATVAAFQYDAFGNTVSETRTNSGTNELTNFSLAYRFNTKYWDAETRLYYYGYRFYRPGTGRWMNRDILAEKRGFNLYCMSINSCVNYFDFLGLETISWAGPPQAGYIAFYGPENVNYSMTWRMEVRDCCGNVEVYKNGPTYFYNNKDSYYNPWNMHAFTDQTSYTTIMSTFGLGGGSEIGEDGTEGELSIYMRWSHTITINLVPTHTTDFGYPLFGAMWHEYHDHSWTTNPIVIKQETGGMFSIHAKWIMCNGTNFLSIGGDYNGNSNIPTKSPRFNGIAIRDNAVK